MTREEKIQLVTELLNTPENTTKLVKSFIIIALPNVEETKLDLILSILEE